MRFFRWFLLVAAIFACTAYCPAQDLAPDYVVSWIFSVVVTNGSLPFVTRGKYKIFTSSAGTNYTVLGNAGSGLSSGNYGYVKTGSNTGLIALADAGSGSETQATLSFVSPFGGTIALTNGAGFQSGTFSAVVNNASAIPPNLFLPELTNGQFQTFLSGQEGVVYTIETSSNLSSWSVWTNVSLSDLTTNIKTALSSSGHFFRAKINATDFAPDSLTNKTFNMTITDGESPLATNGISQWMAGAIGDNYQIIGKSGSTNSSGAYTYTRTSADSGVISYTDTSSGDQFAERLVFTSLSNGYFYLTNQNASGYSAGTFEIADGPAQFIGNIKFVADAARTGSVYFAADGSSASLSVTNATGWVWKLDFPPGALMTPQIITMTPFENVDASASTWSITTGVQLEPDGIQFYDGVTLTATPPSPLGPHASLLMAADDGSNVYFVPTTNQANSYSTVLFHFTSAVASDPSDQDVNDYGNDHLAQATAAYLQAYNEVEALKNEAVEPPEPPDVEFTCDPAQDGLNDFAIYAYQQALFHKESKAIQHLLSTANELVILTGDAHAADPALSASAELISTAGFRKVDSLFSRYSSNPKKLMAVGRVALGLLRQYVLFGGSVDARPDWWEEIQNWTTRAREYYFDKLRKEHDYTLVGAVFDMERQLALLGVNIDFESFLTELNNAMTFKLKMEVTMDTITSSGEEYDAAKGDVALTSDPVNIFPLKGTATIPYQEGYVGPAVLTPGLTFTVNAQVANFDACDKMTANILVDRFGADTETYTIMGFPIPISPGYLKVGPEGLFGLDGYSRLEADGFSFPVPIQNRNVEAVNKTFTSTYPSADGTATATLKLILEHTPK